jgi:hypothetical protein
MTAEELAKDAFRTLKVEGKTLKEWTEEIGVFKALGDIIIPCKECAYFHNKEKCYIAMLCDTLKAGEDIIDEHFKDFWCKDGRRKKE